MRQAFTLIECITVLAILAITSAATIPTFTKLYHTQRSIIVMRQLQMAIHYARSVAILQHATVTICPSINMYSCTNNWQHGVLVLAANGKSRYFNLYLGTGARLFLQQSGNSNSMLQVQTNGLTYTNGHFTYKSLKSSGLAQFNLYFNRALRTYIDEDKWFDHN